MFGARARARKACRGDAIKRGASAREPKIAFGEVSALKKFSNNTTFAQSPHKPWAFKRRHANSAL